MIRVGISGATGRMGRTLIQAIRNENDLILAAALGSPTSAMIGMDSGAVAGISDNNISVSDRVTAVVGASDVVIDFSVADATLSIARVCAEAHKGIVVGTTGIGGVGVSALKELSRSIPMVVAPNMSIGVNVAFKLVELASSVFVDSDVEVYEIHHRFKVDAPSGTAVRMAEIAAATRKQRRKNIAAREWDGMQGEHQDNHIGIHSARGGDVVGDHTITFAGMGERIEITHRSQSRLNFAYGAFRAARYVAQRIDNGETGWFGMNNVLGL